MSDNIDQLAQWLALFVAIGIVVLAIAGGIELVIHRRQRKWLRRLHALQAGRMRQARAE